MIFPFHIIFCTCYLLFIRFIAVPAHLSHTLHQLFYQQITQIIVSKSKNFFKEFDIQLAHLAVIKIYYNDFVAYQYAVYEREALKSGIPISKLIFKEDKPIYHQIFKKSNPKLSLNFYEAINQQQLPMKKTQIFPSVNSKSSNHINQEPSFKVRPTLKSKDKENIYSNTSMISAKAKAYLNKVKSFDSPQLIFALNDSIRKQENGRTHYCSNFRGQDVSNKTIHHCPSAESNNSNNFDCLSLNRSTNRFYALNKERQKAIELAAWVQQKLIFLNNKENGITLDDILGYKQTVINYGLGQIMDNVTKRCKQEGHTLKYIWDATFNLFENILSILTKELRDKDKQMFETQQQMNGIYLQNIETLKKKNKEQENHLELLYQKMAKVIKWNRRLKKEKTKKLNQNKILTYQLDSYSSALQEATQLLLTESKQSNCLNLAKKIIYKLHKSKNSKTNKRSLRTQADQYVYNNAKQYVLAWLKKYSFENQDNLKEAVNLTNDEKFELMQMDEEENQKFDIFDYFQNYQIGIQVKPEMENKQTQYEKQLFATRMINVGIGTKKKYFVSTQIQATPTATNISQQNIPVSTNIKVSMPKQRLQRGSVIEPRKFLRQSVIRRSSQVTKNKSSMMKTGQKIIHSRFQQQKNETLLGSQFNEVKQQQNDFSSRGISMNENKSIEHPAIGKSQDTMKSFDEWEGESYKIDRLQVSGQRRGSLDKIKLTKQQKRKSSYRGSQKQIPQNRENYQMRPLKNKKFDETYNSDLKQQLTYHKQEIITNLVRRRSFYAQNDNKKPNRQMIGYLYRPGRALTLFLNNPLNSYEQKLQSLLKNLNKKNNVNLNPNMAKNQQYTKNLFSSISSTLKPIPVNNIPKNKNYVNLSVSGMTKFISKLLLDYLRRIKCEKDKIFMEAEKVYFPLSVILIDQMTNRYGLRQIAEKKLRDFMEKLNNFVSVSERIKLFHKLLGISPQDCKIGGQQLLIYMKCIVYFDINKTIPSLNVGKDKDFSIQRVKTNKETILNQLPGLISDFFPNSEDSEIVVKIIEKQLQKKSPQLQLDVERIAFILIEQFTRLKKLRYEQYLLLWKNCQGNFFQNLYKTLQIYRLQPKKIINILGQALKQADCIDEIYGKTMNEIKFVGFCCKMNIPLYTDIKKRMDSLVKQVQENLGIENKSAQQKEEIINRVLEAKNIRFAIQKDVPDYKIIRTSQAIVEITQINLESLLGNLEIISNATQNLQWKKI